MFLQNSAYGHRGAGGLFVWFFLVGWLFLHFAASSSHLHTVNWILHAHEESTKDSLETWAAP